METLFVGHNWIQLNQVDSTNDYALELCKNRNVPEGTIISTLNQTKGKGQPGNNWISEEGKNITISVILKPTFILLERQFLLNQFIALAVSDFLTEVGLINIQIKWPNDILVNQKKIAGILIENNLSGRQIKNCIVGVGVNINQTTFNSMDAFTTSVIQESSRFYDVRQADEILCKKIEKRYLELKSNRAKIELDYQRLLFGRNKFYSYTYNNQEIKAKVLQVEINGMLKLQEESGKEIQANFQEIKLLKNTFL